MITPSQQKSLLRVAYAAATRSPDPSTQCGALLYDPECNRILSTACNTFTHGITVLPEMLERPLKYQMIEHAEQNALHSVLRYGLTMPKHPILVAPWAACTECAKAITQSGVKTLVRHGKATLNSPDRWLESLVIADKIMLDGGVDIIDYHGDLIGAHTILFNGEEWQP